MRKTILEMKGITKYIFDAYGKAMKNSDVRILSDVSFDLREGEVHILCGENGAGKSTLMKVLDGIIPADEGNMTLNGEPLILNGPKEAKDKGIVFIHQELNMCLNLDIAHNIFLGKEPKKGLKVDHKTMYEESRKLLDSLGFHDMDPKTLTKNLTTAQQQVVEIIKAISYDAKIIIMDEPTSSLSDKEIQHLFEIIKELKEKGCSIIYISHRFDELMEIGDRLTILRDGQSIKTMDMKDFDYDEVVRLMVGRPIESMYKCKRNSTGDIVLELKNFKVGKDTKPLNISVKRGEVVGFGGLVGAGRTELFKSVIGAREFYGGEIIYEGNELTRLSPKKAVKKGICYLTEDRKIEGLVLEMSVRENVSLVAMEKVFKGNVVHKRKDQICANKAIGQLNVRCRSSEQLTSTLSGGNQQKVLFAKWMTADPKVLILDEPTRGIDVNAKAEIYGIIDDIASQGVAVIMISSELPELIGMSDRIYVMRQGTIVNELTEKKEMTQENILKDALYDNTKV